MSMREVSEDEYRQFVKQNPYVVIDGVKIPLTSQKKLAFLEPLEFQLEKTTVWSFPARGKWATHRGNYRGNWAPEIPRNLILRYTQPGDMVLDQMVGSGTTLVECKLLGRNGIGVDINYEALMVAWNRLDFDYKNPSLPEVTQRLYLGDARHLELISGASIDLVATHPPYANIISYSRKPPQEGDLSKVASISEFIENMRRVAQECWRVLKPNKHCAILIGDTHRHKHYVPIAYRVMETFLECGFILREDVIKLQWNVKTERERWSPKRQHDFFLTFHEHLFIFRKPDVEENVERFKESVYWRG